MLVEIEKYIFNVDIYYKKHDTGYNTGYYYYEGKVKEFPDLAAYCDTYDDCLDMIKDLIELSIKALRKQKQEWRLKHIETID